jgi:hypothetical protein
LIQEIRRYSIEQMEQTAGLPDGACLDFDPADELSELVENPTEAHNSHVLKTSQRTVVSLEHGRFQAREIVREETQNSRTVIRRSAQLAGLIAKGSRYAFDLIAHVGVESFLRGRSLQDIGQELACHHRTKSIPSSSLWDQQQKFLFYLGHVHKQATPILRQQMAEHRPVVWLLDGTIEPGTPVFLGIQHAGSGILLSSWRIPSENEDDIADCLEQATASHGRPDRVLHDLSSAMSGACDRALDGVPHFVCHYHLTSDVGEDLYEKPQAALCKRMRAIKVQVRLREQRKGQKEWLRQRVDSPAQLVLQNLLADEPVNVLFNQTLGREVLLAFHYWILDYRSDGRRRGFPFDPYTLYLHRRLVRAANAVDRLLGQEDVSRQAPQVLFNFQKQLQQYCTDRTVVEAADLYERSHSMFGRLRQALRLTAETMHNMRQPQELPTDQQEELKTDLDRLRSELRQESEAESNGDRALAKIVLVHLDKYWLHLVPKKLPAEGECWERTTNQLESHWRSAKRGRRRTHGRGKLVRDFQALPEEYMLVPNLENETYVQLVLGGSLDGLPTKLAQASRDAGSFSDWQRRRRPQITGQIPRRLLRHDGFIDHLIMACGEHCQKPERVAA